MAIPCIPAFIVAAGFFNETLKNSRVAICVLDICSVTIQYNQSSSSLTPQVVKHSSVLIDSTDLFFFAKLDVPCNKEICNKISAIHLSPIHLKCVSHKVYSMYSVKTTEHDNLFSCHIDSY